MTPEEYLKFGIVLYQAGHGKIGVATTGDFGFRSGTFGSLTVEPTGIDVSTLPLKSELQSLGVDTSTSKGVLPSTTLESLLAQAKSSQQAKDELQQQVAASNAFNQFIAQAGSGIVEIPDELLTGVGQEPGTLVVKDGVLTNKASLTPSPGEATPEETQALLARTPEEVVASQPAPTTAPVVAPAPTPTVAPAPVVAPTTTAPAPTPTPAPTPEQTQALLARTPEQVQAAQLAGGAQGDLEAAGVVAPGTSVAPTPAPTPISTQQDLFRVPTGSTGPGGEQISDVFFGTEFIQDPTDPRLAGVDIAGLPTGQAPEGFESQFLPVSAPAPAPVPPPTIAPPAPELPPPPPPTPPAQEFTVAQDTNANNQLYKEWNPDTQNWDVFNLDGTPMKDVSRFESKELNIDHINTQQQIQDRGEGATAVDETFADGAVTTGELPSEQADFFKTIQERMQKTDDLVSQLLGTLVSTDREKELQASIDKITTSFEAGAVGIEGQTIPMQLILGQQLQLERQANAKLAGLQRELSRITGDRETQGRILEAAYNANRQSISDAIAFYQLTAPEKLTFDENTGTIFFQNPMTGEITSKILPGYEPTPEGQTTAIKEYQFAQTQGYTGSFLQYQAFKSTQFGTEGGVGAGGGVIGGTQVSSATMNVFSGAQKLDDLGSTQRTKTAAELRNLGFYSETVPSWFRQEAENQAKASIPTQTLSNLWEETRQDVIKTGGLGSLGDLYDSLSTQ